MNMLRARSLAGRFVFSCLLIISGILSTLGQTTIFNIPSTDTVSKRLFFIEGDFISHFDTYQNGGFQTYGYRTVYGAKNNLELGTNFFYTRNGSRPSPKELQPNFKWKSYTNEKYRIGMSTGIMFFVPLNRNSGNRVSSLLYSNASKVFPKTRGTRLTGGMYTYISARSEVGTKMGVTLGLEQPIKGRLSFLADWYSGNNRFGYSAAGFNYAISPKQYILAGYNFGNYGRGNNAFSAFYGYTF